jgi:hypothetical protein
MFSSVVFRESTIFGTTKRIAASSKHFSDHTAEI